jgi:ankyrin repeat protein
MSATSAQKRDLVLASHDGNLERVKDLLKAKVDPNTQNKFHITPLYAASEEGHTDVVRALLEAGADPLKKAKDNLTPFQAAKRAGKDAVEKVLCETLDKTASKTDKPMLFTATEEDDLTRVEALLDAGASVDVKLEVFGWTSLHLAARNGSTKIVKALLEAGADINAKTKKGQTPLFMAETNKQDEVIALLKEKGAVSAAKKGGSRSRMTKKRRRSLK